MPRQTHSDYFAEFDKKLSARWKETPEDKLQWDAGHKTAAAFRRAAECVAAARKLREAHGVPKIYYVDIFPEINVSDREYAIDPYSDVVSRAMDILKPINLPEDDCRQIIALHMNEARVLSFDKKIPIMSEIKNRIAEVADRLKFAKRAILNLPRIARVAQAVYWNDFCDLIDEVVHTVEQDYDSIILGSGGKTLDLSKQAAANSACELIREFTQERPTKSENGRFYQLASIIYEGATNIPDADLSRFCRRAADTL